MDVVLRVDNDVTLAQFYLRGIPEEVFDTLEFERVDSNRCITNEGSDILFFLDRILEECELEQEIKIKAVKAYVESLVDIFEGALTLQFTLTKV